MTTQPTNIKPLPRDNGMTEERFAEVLAYLRECNKDPEYKEYLKRTAESAKEAREQINEQARQWLDEQDQERKLTR